MYIQKYFLLAGFYTPTLQTHAPKELVLYRWILGTEEISEKRSVVKWDENKAVNAWNQKFCLRFMSFSPPRPQRY